MRRSLPPLNALRAFEAAARLGSISAAAEELFVTHGAVSRQIQAFEAAVGVAVFERRGRRIRLTEAGRVYLDVVRTAFDSIARATDRLSESGRVRQLTINGLPTFTMRWLLPRLNRFQRRHPGLELRLATSVQSLTQLGEFDVAIRRGPETWPDMEWGVFLRERETPVCAPALLAASPIETPSDLARHTLLHADTRPAAWARWQGLAGVPGLVPAGRQRFDHFYLALQAALDGLGVALGPLPIIDEELSAGRLVAPLAGLAVPARSYCWIRRPGIEGEPSIAAEFCAWLDQEGAAEADPDRADSVPQPMPADIG